MLALRAKQCALSHALPCLRGSGLGKRLTTLLQNERDRAKQHSFPYWASIPKVEDFGSEPLHPYVAHLLGTAEREHKNGIPFGSGDYTAHRNGQTLKFKDIIGSSAHYEKYDEPTQKEDDLQQNLRTLLGGVHVTTSEEWVQQIDAPLLLYHCSAQTDDATTEWSRRALALTGTKQVRSRRKQLNFGC